MDKPRLWTKDFISITLLSFFLGFSLFLLLVAMSAYAKDIFASSPSAAGFAAGIFLLGGIIARIFFGGFIERIGRRNMLFMSLSFNLVMILLYFVANNYVTLLIVRFFHGAAFGIAMPVAMAIVANIIPQKRKGEGIAYYLSIGSTLGQAIGPLISMFIIQENVNYDVIFLICLGSAVLSFICAFILSVPEVKLTEEQLQETKEFKFNRIFSIKALPISTVNLVIYICWSGVVTFLTLYSREIDLINVAKFFFIATSVTILISRLFVGRLYDLKGENIIMYPAILILMLGLFTLSQANNGLTLMIAAVLIGTSMGNVFSTGNTIAVNSVPPHQTGLAVSTFITSADMGLGIGPLLLGLFIPLASSPEQGYRNVYLGLAILALACVLLYYLIHGRKAGHGRVSSNPE